MFYLAKSHIFPSRIIQIHNVSVVTYRFGDQGTENMDSGKFGDSREEKTYQGTKCKMNVLQFLNL